jgi:NADH:ubiquinone oxidoreductase subunit 5 (subunit L)/multisubunit Na+/H+ antiporter MnhA subunit
VSILIGAIPLIAVAAAPCVLWLAGRLKVHPGWISAAVLGALLAALGRLAPLVLAGRTIALSLPWFPAFGLRYALVLDGLGLLFALLITGAGVLIFIYSAEYMPREPQLGRFYAHLLLFAAPCRRGARR